VLGERKFGGNAQAITSRRWLHHTSFLWDYQPASMELLTNPAKQPAYRQARPCLGAGAGRAWEGPREGALAAAAAGCGHARPPRHPSLTRRPSHDPAPHPIGAQRREHSDFLMRLKDALPCRAGLLDAIEAAAAAEGLALEPAGLEEAAAALGGSYLKQNRVVDVAAALEEAAAAAAAAAAGSGGSRGQAAAAAGGGG
jgi:hypothetical protein